MFQTAHKWTREPRHLTCPSFLTAAVAHSLGDEVAFSWVFKPDPAVHPQLGLWNLWLKTAQSRNAPEKHHSPLPVALLDLPTSSTHPTPPPHLLPTPTPTGSGQAWSGFRLVNCFFSWQDLSVHGICLLSKAECQLTVEHRLQLVTGAHFSLAALFLLHNYYSPTTHFRMFKKVVKID